MTTKYVPPHKRNQSPDSHQDKHEDKHYSKVEDTRPQNKRRDLSQASKLNTLVDTHVQPVQVHDIVEIPKCVDPPIVQFPLKCEILAQKPLVRDKLYSTHTISEKNDPKSDFAHQLGLSGSHECVIELAEKIYDMRMEVSNKEFVDWADYYESELLNMYNTCADPRLDISYSKFVEAAYKCSTTRYDPKKFKQTRPLD